MSDSQRIGKKKCSAPVEMVVGGAQLCLSACRQHCSFLESRVMCPAGVRPTFANVIVHVNVDSTYHLYLR